LIDSIDYSTWTSVFGTSSVKQVISNWGSNSVIVSATGEYLKRVLPLKDTVSPLYYAIIVDALYVSYIVRDHSRCLEQLNTSDRFLKNLAEKYQQKIVPLANVTEELIWDVEALVLAPIISKREKLSKEEIAVIKEKISKLTQLYKQLDRDVKYVTFNFDSEYSKIVSEYYWSAGKGASSVVLVTGSCYFTAGLGCLVGMAAGGTGTWYASDEYFKSAASLSEYSKFKSIRDGVINMVEVWAPQNVQAWEKSLSKQEGTFSMSWIWPC